MLSFGPVNSLKAVSLMPMTRESVDLIAAILAAGVLAATGLNIIQEQDAVDRWIKIRDEINNNLKHGKLAD
jgi:hypothetical protein